MEGELQCPQVCPSSPGASATRAAGTANQWEKEERDFSGRESHKRTNESVWGTPMCQLNPNSHPEAWH